MLKWLNQMAWWVLMYLMHEFITDDALNCCAASSHTVAIAFPHLVVGGWYYQ